MDNINSSNWNLVEDFFPFLWISAYIESTLIPSFFFKVWRSFAEILCDFPEPWFPIIKMGLVLVKEWHCESVDVELLSFAKPILALWDASIAAFKE